MAGTTTHRNGGATVSYPRAHSRQPSLDVQAVSFSPFSHQAAFLASLQSSLTRLKNKYGKDVMVTETNWPRSCPKPAYDFPSDVKNIIPFSVAGQGTWLKDVARVVTAAGGTGIFYWEPAWLHKCVVGQ